MTGYDDRNIDNGGLPTRPSIGSILSRTRGPNNLSTGMPTYVRLGGIGADGPAFLGAAFAPFDSTFKKTKASARSSSERISSRSSAPLRVDGGGTPLGITTALSRRTQ